VFTHTFTQLAQRCRSTGAAREKSL